MKKVFNAITLTLLLVFCTSLLLACAPSDLAKAKEKMEEAGYNVILTEAKEDNEDNKVGSIVVTKISIGASFEAEGLTATLFKTAKDAKAYYEKHVDDETDEEDQTLKISGKWVYFGTQSAIDAFLK